MIFENVNNQITRQSKNQEKSTLAGKHFKVILGEVKYLSKIVYFIPNFSELPIFIIAQIGIN